MEPEDVHVVKKGFVVLPCAAVSPGGEHTQIHWLHGNTNVSRTGPRHLVLQDNSLLLTNVRVSDEGVYSCVAGNQHGRSVFTAELTVSSECVYVLASVLTQHVCRVPGGPVSVRERGV